MQKARWKRRAFLLCPIEEDQFIAAAAGSHRIGNRAHEGAPLLCESGIPA
jgi:hypothetical protein